MATMFDLDNLQNQSLLNIPNDTGFAVRPDYSKAGSNMARLSGFDLKSEAELNAMNQAEVDKYSENRLAARNKGIGELLYMFSDALKGKDIQQGAQARQQNRMLMQQDQERIARQQQLNEFITNANIPDSQKALLGTFPPSVQAEILAKQEFGNNKDQIVKGADGFNYFVGTGERVLPNVGTKPYEIKTTDIISAQKDERKTFQATNKGVKNFQQLLDAAQAADGAASYALMIKFIKQLDDSVVREGEVATFGGFQGALTNLKNQISKTSGEGFTPDVKANMINLASQTANRLVNDYAVYRRGKETSYGSIGFNPNTVFAGLDFNLGGLDLTKTYTPSDFEFIELE